jgi:hypothetical protein
MGLGDVKFMAAIGAFIGWQGVVFSLAVSAFIGADCLCAASDFDAGARGRRGCPTGPTSRWRGDLGFRCAGREKSVSGVYPDADGRDGWLKIFWLRVVRVPREMRPRFKSQSRCIRA